MANRQKTSKQSSSTLGWPIDLRGLQYLPHWITSPLLALAGIVVISLVIFALISIARLGLDLIGDDRNRAAEAIRSILPLAAAGIGLPLIIWRLVILSRQTATSEAKTQIDRETHYTSIFSNSVNQLGQTKEVKEPRDQGENIETISRTVPNIEVRLGAIHSLSRLAEESIRDAKKIRNMLLSYIRENSWTNRAGTSTTLPKRSRQSATDWHYYFTKEEVDERDEESLDAWVDNLKSSVEQDQEWSVTLVDTRVDVNEATDAVYDVSEALDDDTPILFYEALFVGRLFRKEALRLTRFERCTLVRCHFEAENADLYFANCNLIACELSSENSTLFIYTSYVTNLSSYFTTTSTLSFASCELWDVNLWGVKNSDISFPSTTAYDLWLGSNDSPITLVADSAAFVNARFFRIVLSEKSEINATAFAQSSFDKVDMGAVTEIHDSSLNLIKADPRSRHPAPLERPETWPDYDPDYVDEDEIPF